MSGAHRRPVAVFDAALPPGVATIRSLGRAGVPVHAYSHLPYAPGRFSRHVARFDVCPDPVDIDVFTAWLRDEVETGHISLVAPTSDYVTFAVAQLETELGLDLSGGVGGTRGHEGVDDCLFKDRFARRLEEVGFPGPPWAAPTSTDEAVEVARTLGYPVVLKPRSHIGIGVSRGLVVNDDGELRTHFVPYPLSDSVRGIAERHPDLAFPLVQKMVTGNDVECISVTGCLGRDGTLLASGTIRKVDQWGSSLAIGTVFEATTPPPFVEHAVETVARVLGTGIFEFEVLSDRASGEYWAIDLNPRGFGPMSLDVENGNDLPLLWYRAATGAEMDPQVAVSRGRTTWRMGAPFYAGISVGIVLGPQRFGYVRQLLDSIAHPSAGAIHHWRDVRPGFAWLVWNLRHPGGLVRPHLTSRTLRRSRTSTG